MRVSLPIPPAPSDHAATPTDESPSKRSTTSAMRRIATSALLSDMTAGPCSQIIAQRLTRIRSTRQSGSMRFRRNRHLLVVGALWAVLGGIVALVTSQMGDWYAMTDEMRYERLAISIAQTHSLVPRIHGVDIRSFSQLYPLLISPAFARGFATHDLRVAR